VRRGTGKRISANFSVFNASLIACARGLIATLLVLCTASFAAPATEVG